MALAYTHRFRALAIQSATYATCGGACVLPDPSEVPADHPPTIFLHGQQDDIIPIESAEGYRALLAKRGVTTDFVRDPNAGHAWLAESASKITAWFEQY